MGLKCSLDYAQEATENIFCDLIDTNVYIHNAEAFSKKWEEHIVLVYQVCGELVEH